MRYPRFVLLGLLAALLLLPWSGARASVDSDGDGYDDAMEAYLGTDPNLPCGPNAWPPDMNDDTLVTFQDFLPYLFLPPHGIGLLYRDPEWSPAVQRLDLSGDGAVSVVSDMWYHIVPVLFTTCAGGPIVPPVWAEGDPVTMGIDPETSGNSAITLGDLESCVRVDVAPASLGDGAADHTIDVYVTGDTEAPTGYDAWMVYDPGRVDPVTWDALIKFPDPEAWDLTIKKTSRLNAAGFDYDDPGISGDGTIARIDLDAISAGPACFAFGFAKAYSSSIEFHPTIPQAAMAAINEDCPTEDSDGDGVFDVCDTCLSDVNPGQEDFDADGSGDACDNCPDTANPGQEESDQDGLGDICDNCPDDPDCDDDLVSDGPADPDGGGSIVAGPDNCPNTANPGQENIFRPETFAGDLCEDFDNDLVLDIDDNCPDTANAGQGDFDQDGFGDICDNYPDDPDYDDDLVSDGPADPDGGGSIVAGPDNCPNTANGPNEAGIPGVRNQTNTDADNETAGFRFGSGSPPPILTGDSDGDACDTDDDNDGFTEADERAIYGVGPGSDEELTPCRTDTVYDPWPPDLFGSGGPPDRFVNFQDLNAMVPKLFSSPPGPPYDIRFDLFEPTGAFINFQDLNLAVPFLFQGCEAPP